MPTVHNEDPKPIPEGVWRRIWFSALEDSDRVALGLGYLCGLRRREVVRLSPGNFTPDGKLTGVQRKGGKLERFPFESALKLHETRLGHLVGDLSSQFSGPLARLRSERSGRPVLLPWRDERSERHVTRRDHGVPDESINPDTFNRRLRRVLRSCGLPEQTVTPHMLRHSFCTNLISIGVPIHTVSRIAGHSSVNVTMRYVSLGDDPLAPFVGDDDHGTPTQANRFA